MTDGLPISLLQRPFGTQLLVAPRSPERAS